jgi:regulator of vacuolar morphogenesis
LILIVRYFHPRSEAKGVPHLLVAPQATSQHQHSAENDIHNGLPDVQEGGYYADGAYTAAPPTNLPITSDHGPPDAQDLYYESLSARFRLLHATLKCNPPLSAIQVLPSSSLISLPPDTETARSQWRYHLQSSNPLTVQLACMDSESVLEVVKLLTGTMAQTVRSRSRGKILRYGAWVWGVLGKCRDRTELGSEEIAILRELGKRAVKLLVSIRDKAGKDNDAARLVSERTSEDANESILASSPAAEIALGDAGAADGTMQEADLDFDRPASNEQDAAEVKLAKKRLEGSFLSNVDIEHPLAPAVIGDIDDTPGINAADARLDMDQQIRITLDMIVTIVGDFYGQRDLLEFRDIWNED